MSSVDVVPTLLAAAGLDATAGGRLPGSNLLAPPSGLASVSSRPAADGNEGLHSPRSERSVFGVIYPGGASGRNDRDHDWHYRWARRGSWKLIDASSPEENDYLFDLSRDPSEQQNLILNSEASAIRRALQAEIDEWWRSE